MEFKFWDALRQQHETKKNVIQMPEMVALKVELYEARIQAARETLRRLQAEEARYVETVERHYQVEGWDVYLQNRYWKRPASQANGALVSIEEKD
jgi:hypothetical protein